MTVAASRSAFAFARPSLLALGAPLLAGLLAGCTPTPVRESEAPAPALELSDSDLVLADGTVRRALESGRRGDRFSWSNAATGRSGEVSVTRTYRVAGGAWCREYAESIRDGAAVGRYADRACRNADGVWIIVE